MPSKNRDHRRNGDIRRDGDTKRDGDPRVGGDLRGPGKPWRGRNWDDQEEWGPREGMETLQEDGVPGRDGAPKMDGGLKDGWRTKEEWGCHERIGTLRGDGDSGKGWGPWGRIWTLGRDGTTKRDRDLKEDVGPRRDRDTMAGQQS